MTWLALDPIWIIHNAAAAEQVAEAWTERGSNPTGLWREFTAADHLILELMAPGAWMTHHGDVSRDLTALDWFREHGRHPLIVGPEPRVDQ